MPYAVELHLDAAVFEFQHRRDALNPLDHAGGDGGEKELRRVEGVRPSAHVGIEDDFGILAVRETAVRVRALGRYFVFELVPP